MIPSKFHSHQVLFKMQCHILVYFIFRKEISCSGVGRGYFKNIMVNIMLQLIWMTNNINDSTEWENWFCRRGSQKWLDQNSWRGEIGQNDKANISFDMRNKNIINMWVHILIGRCGLRWLWKFTTDSISNRRNVL